ncbi:Cmx/CmrA family chloramphenicol efflux MFS transporter [Nocardia arthritidis]|uniref:Cmx/CmrA family chloramphenicol efflux MFS transporter n=1 Tax=Nocardia arthritidis TaxID=228602 RepID=A0A6G9YDA5_9NOCA|nr:Cmx/CmrA family chloramphenicol efflux MFS transporter [Nocardia arthritidis]QIS10993.1 Cmx/CmrA family chloramphenicol efflux MFS transporter [Nocardia arthritidis]
MPVAVYVLGLAIFAQGTSELMLAGILTEMSSDLGVSVPQAGLLVSAFALGMLVGAPVLAATTLRLSRRTALLGFLAVFVIAHVIGALTSSYWVLFGTRVIAAFVYAGFWAVGAATAISLTPPNKRGRAMGIVAGGLTVATIIGLPAGTVIGQHWGWRAAFWAVAALSALAMLGVLARIPAARAAEIPDLRRELRSLVNPRVWLHYGTTALQIASLMVTFTYLGALLTETTGLAAGWVPVVLTIYGVGAVLGIAIGGRTADTHPVRTLYLGFAGLIGTSVLLALTGQYAVTAVLAAFLLGAFGFGVNPTLNSRIFALAADGPTLGTAFNTSAFNVGITVGPWLGGLAIGAGLGYPATAWIGVVLGIAAIGTLRWSQALHRNSAPAAPEPALAN